MPDRRGAMGPAFPSPLVMLTVIAVAMAGIAFVATRDDGVTERQITPVAAPSATPTPSATPSAEPTRKPKPLDRSKVPVVVFNNTGITGLAGRVSQRAAGAGWQVVGSDNWVGTIPASTVYYPPRLKRAARQLGLDLGIRRIKPNVGSMSDERLTIVLTGELP